LTPVGGIPEQRPPGQTTTTTKGGESEPGPTSAVPGAGPDPLPGPTNTAFPTPGDPGRGDDPGQREPDPGDEAPSGPPGVPGGDGRGRFFDDGDDGAVPVYPDDGAVLVYPDGSGNDGSQAVHSPDVDDDGEEEDETNALGSPPASGRVPLQCPGIASAKSKTMVLTMGGKLVTVYMDDGYVLVGTRTVTLSITGTFSETSISIASPSTSGASIRGSNAASPQCPACGGAAVGAVPHQGLVALFLLLLLGKIIIGIRVF